MKNDIKTSVYFSEPQLELVDSTAAADDLTRAAFMRKVFAFYFQQQGYEWPGRVE